MAKNITQQKKASNLEESSSDYEEVVADTPERITRVTATSQKSSKVSSVSPKDARKSSVSQKDAGKSSVSQKDAGKSSVSQKGTKKTLILQQETDSEPEELPLGGPDSESENENRLTRRKERVIGAGRIGRTGGGKVTELKARRMKEENVQRRKQDILPYTVVGLKIDILRSKVLKGLSVGTVTNVIDDGEGGINDPKAGTLDDYSLCRTCNEVNVNCVGHPQRIPLPAGVEFIPTIYLDTVLKILRCVCRHCSGLLVTEMYMRSCSRGNLMEYRGGERLTKLAEECVDSKLACRRGIAQNKEVLGKYGAFNELVMDTTGRVNSECISNPIYRIQINTIQWMNANSKKRGVPAHRSMHEVEEDVSEFAVKDIKHVLSFISKGDIALMGFPSDFELTGFICDSIPCIPPCARPQNYHDGNVRIDQISFALHDIVAKINQYNANAAAGPNADSSKSSAGPSSQQDLLRSITWNIYGHVVDNSDESYKRGTEAITSVKERITGKKGEIRGNSMGKRVQFVERTVLGPDSTLRFGQVGVPEITRTELTVPVTVTKHNLTEMQRLLNEHKVKVLIPGPGRGTKGKGFKFEGSKVLITDKNRNLFKYLVPGDIISRHGQDGDRCLFGRQPTLHKEGLQGHSKVYGPAKTLRVHMCNTTAYNADFDGDEGTEHTPQTTGAIVENAYLVNSESCIGDGQKSKVMAGLTYNHLSSLYLATQNGQMKKVLDAKGRNLASGKFDLTREEFARVRASLIRDEVILSEEEKEEVSDILTQRQDFPTLPARLRTQKVDPLSGRGLFSHVLPADFNYDGEPIILEFKVEGRTEKVDLSVRIRDGVLISGTLTKSHVGGVHNSIVQYLWKNYGKRRTADFLTDGTFFADWFIYNYGFSIGYEDCKAPDQEAVRRTVDGELYNAQLSIDSLGPERPDMTREEKSYREQQTRDFTNNAANIGKKIAREQLSYSNPLNIMDSSGAKGNPVNTAQICGIVGQQYVRRERPDPQLDGKRRCLHFFAPNSRKLEARGMVRQSFLEGMNPAGTIFHMIATRVGLVGTAVLTASTGTLHHRLSKVLESTAVQNDGSIRNCTGAIFQLTCFDGFGAEQMIPTKLRKETVYSFIDISATVKNLNQNIQNRLKELNYEPPKEAPQ